MDDTKKALLSIDIDTTALTQNVANAKSSVTDLTAQLKALKSSADDNTDSLGKVSDGLKNTADAAGKSADALKQQTRSMSDSTTASTNLKGSLADLSKQHTGLQADTTKTTRTVSDYTSNILHAVESVTPFGKSIAETAEKFKTFQEGASKVGSALGLFKKDGDAAATNALTLSTNAGNATKGFEALTTGTEVAAGGVSTFAKALAATGISLVIIAVSALIDYFKQFTPLVEATERLTAGLSGGFNALGRIVGELITPLKKLFTDPKQAMVDLVNFLEQNVINRFKALGVIIDGITNHNFKEFADGVIQLNTCITNATDKLGNFSKAIIKAGVDTANLKGEQQELNRSMQSEALKAAQTEAAIAELRVKAQTGDLAARKGYLKQIADLEATQAKLHKDNIDNGLTLAIKDVALKHALTQQEIADIRTKGAAELDVLVASGRIYADDVKTLSEALNKKYELRKAYADKQQGLHAAALAAHKKNKEEVKKDDKEATDEKKAQDAILANQELSDQKELFDLKREAAIKALGDEEKNYQKIYELRTEQNDKDLEIELKNTELTETQKLIIQEKYAQKQLDLDNNYQQTKANNAKKAKESNLDNLQQQATAEDKFNLNKLNSYQAYFTKIGNLFAKHTEASKAAFIAQKAIASAEVAINTEKQISSIISATKTAVSGDMDYGPIIGPIKAAVDIAIGAAEVVGTIANGAKQINTINSTNPQGFARGGMYLSDGYGAYLTGPGSSTSDSINAKLSNGEAIINARSTAMFAPILSAINMAGGGRAFGTTSHGNGYALGGLFNASNTLNDASNELANTRAMNNMVKAIATNMPRQVLVVEDVQASLQNKVMLQNMSNF